MYFPLHILRQYLGLDVDAFLLQYLPNNLGQYQHFLWLQEHYITEPF